MLRYFILLVLSVTSVIPDYFTWNQMCRTFGGEMNLTQNVYIIFVIDYIMPSTIFVEFYKAKLP